MKRKNLLTFILASFFILMAFHGSHTYASISGGEVCGDSAGKECTINDLKKISQGIFSLIISVGLPLLIVFIVYRFVMAWYALQQGNANAYKEAGKKVTEGIIGFIIIVALFGGIFLAMLKYFSASTWTTTLLQKMSVMEVIPHAYAGTASVCAPPQVGSTCYFTANGTKQVGVVTDPDSFIDKALFCKDAITGLTSNTYVVNNNKYWRGQTDCSGKTNGTVCDRGATNYGSMGTCSDSYTPPPQSGPAECLGKVDKTFCKARPGSSIFGSAGVCNLRGTVFTCDLASTGEVCFSPTTQKEGTISNSNGFCGVVGDPCTMNSGGMGVYSSSYNCIAKPVALDAPVDPNAPPGGSTDPAPTTPQAPTQLRNPTGFTSLYDFIIGTLNVVMKFFLYPALIGIWVWSGFSYVIAQGAPEKLSKAHKLLLWAVISTLIVFITQGFLMAVKGSVNKILSTTTTTVQQVAGSEQKTPFV